MNELLAESLKYLEGARRAGHYLIMEEAADTLVAYLESHRELSQVERHAVLARIKYELHMAAYQQAMVEPETDKRKELLEKSEKFVCESAREAMRAGDTAGKLLALMNVPGLLAIPLGYSWRDAFKVSEEVSDEAEAFAAAPETSEKDRRRAWRAAVNCYFHRWRMLRDHDGDRDAIAVLLAKIEANPVYADPSDSSYRDAEAAEVEEIHRHLER